MVREILAAVDAGTMDAEEAIEEIEHLAEEGEDEHDDHGHGLYDPHFWFDPIRVQVAVSEIAGLLAALDPDRSDAYRANADAYNAQLDELHAWTEEQVGMVPTARRLLVTSHDSLGYFAARYGFEVVGTVIPSISTEVEPSAEDLVALTEEISKYDVPAVFGETTVSERLAEAVAAESGALGRPALLGLAGHGGQRRGHVRRHGAHERRAHHGGAAVTRGPGPRRAATLMARARSGLPLRGGVTRPGPSTESAGSGRAMTTASEPGIRVENLCVERGGQEVLTDVSFDVGPGMLVGVLGPNGAGKSTLFDAIAGVLPASRGAVTRRGAAAQEGALAYVPQRDSINWVFPATVHDVVMMGRVNHIGLLRRPGKRDKEAVRRCLERVDMWDNRSAPVTQLSGGQRQRVFIARALAQEAIVIMLDEAFSGVDVGAQEGIVEVLQSLRDEGRIVLLATHDLTNLAQRFDQVLCINCHVCACGPPDEAFTPAVLEELYRLARGRIRARPPPSSGRGLMIDYIVGPFEYSFMVRALIVSVLVGIMCPVVGAYVITRGRAFMGDALAHSVLPGMVVAFLLGVSPFVAAVPAGIAIALLMGSVGRRTGITEDTSIGIIFAGMFALGLVMLSQSTNVTVNIEDLLLGQVLRVSQTDVYVSLGLTALVVAGLYAFHRQFTYTTFDIVGAQVVGIRTGVVEYVLLSLLALVIVLGIQAAGIVLVMAMPITPAATAYLLAKRFVGVMLLGALIGVISAIAGLYLSFHADLPSGPAMALVATALFGLAAVFKRRPV